MATYRAIRHAERWFTLDPEAARARQVRRLSAVVADALTRVAVYRDRCAVEAREAVRAAASLDDLRALVPVLTREAVASVPIEVRRAGPPPVGSRVLRTSGTTGHVLAVEYPPEGAWWQGIVSQRRRRARGVRLWDRQVSYSVLPDERPRTGLVGAVDRRAVRLRSNLPADELARRTAAVAPAVIAGHGHLIVEVGEHLAGRVRPRMISTGGEQLSAEVADRIRELFGAVPLDAYGAIELGSIAWQCPARDLYHLEGDSLVVEVVDEAGGLVAPGQTGELEAWTLWNSHMPFLRYRIGDRARLADRSCACGFSLPALAEVSGRTMDWLVTGAARRLPPQRLFMSEVLGLDALGGMRRYRVVQAGDGSTTIEIERVGGLTAAFLEQVRAGYASALGQPIEVTVVDELALASGGKFRQFTSAVRVSSATDPTPSDPSCPA